MAQCTRPTCAWCGFETPYGFLHNYGSYKGPVVQYLINGAQVWLHLRCKWSYENKDQ